MESGISFKGKNLSMSFTKLKYKWLPTIDTDKNILKLIILQKNIKNKRAFLTDEPNKKKSLTTYKYDPISLDLLSENSNQANLFIKQIKKNISEGDNKNVWIYLNNQVIQFPILKINVVKNDKIIIKCEILNKELCDILPKKLYNGTFINQKNNQYGWLTIDAASNDDTYGFASGYQYPFNQSKYENGTLKTTVSTNRVAYMDGLNTPLICTFNPNSNKPYRIYIKGLICIGTFEEGANALFHCFGNDKVDYDDQTGYGYKSGACLNLFLYLDVDQFNRSIVMENSAVNYVKSIYSLFKTYVGSGPSTYGFYQAPLWSNQSGSTLKSSYNYNVTPNYGVFGGNIMDGDSTGLTTWVGSSLPKTNVTKSSDTPLDVTIDLTSINAEPTHQVYDLAKIEATLSYDGVTPIFLISTQTCS